jgi:transposase-like protein
MAENAAPKTLQDAIRYYSDLDVCQQALVEARWPNGVECPTCGSKDVRYLPNQRRWRCRTGQHERLQFSVKIGTIFEDSPLGLDKWFSAIWLITNAKNGISSYELHRAIGVTQKSAWFMLHRIRLAMQTKSFTKIGGTVEVDETYIGGKARNMHVAKRKRLGMSQKASMVGKVAVMGLLDRHGKDGHSTMRTEVIAGRKRHDLRGPIAKHVERGATVNTDAFTAYRGLQSDYVHNVIDHAEKYVDGQIHTNGCENFWSLLKRAIKGTYVSVEPFHLFRYLDEQTLRFNTRTATDGDRFADLIRRVTGKRLTYKDLIGEAERDECVGLA